jgi:hypothetical protein
LGRQEWRKSGECCRLRIRLLPDVRRVRDNGRQMRDANISLWLALKCVPLSMRIKHHLTGQKL